MTTVKRIVCLANSRKISGRCIAGREFDGGRVGAWIRPVSAREHEEISENERQYEDGSDPKVLDIIDVPLAEARPKLFQQENWLIDADECWVRVGRSNWDQLAKLEDASESLWTNGYHTANGLNDQIPLVVAANLNTSLRFIHIDGGEIHVMRIASPFGPARRRVQGRFQYGGQHYSLWVTDPVIERAYLAKPDGRYPLGESYLTISVGEPFNENCYKLVAAIISRELVGG